MSKIGKLLEIFIKQKIENEVVNLSDKKIIDMFNLPANSKYINRVRDLFIDYVSNTDIIFDNVQSAFEELALEYNLEIENNRIKDSEKMIKDIFVD